MNGDRLEYSQAKIRNILKKEFLISEDMLKQRSIEEAAEALETYESIEEFLDKTGVFNRESDMSLGGWNFDLFF